MIVDQIRNTVLKAIHDAEVLVTDPMNDGQHFQAVVISPEFEGLSLIKQHQMVMKPLTQAFATNVHALGLKTFSPSQWEKQ